MRGCPNGVSDPLQGRAINGGRVIAHRHIASGGSPGKLDPRRVAHSRERELEIASKAETTFFLPTKATANWQHVMTPHQPSCPEGVRRVARVCWQG